MGLFNLFGGKKTVELDKVKSDENKNRMREIFDRQVDNGSEYKIVYAYSEDIGGANFVVLRTVSYKYRSFIQIVRGIPSVEYGDLTSGAVIINTKAGREPLQKIQS